MIEIFKELSKEEQKSILVEQIINIEKRYAEINTMLKENFNKLSKEERKNIIYKLKATRLSVDFSLDLIEISTIDENIKQELLEKLGTSYALEEKNIITKIK